MKRIALAALAAATLMTGGAAMAAPMHGGHGPVSHGPVSHGPVLHNAGPTFRGPTARGPDFRQSNIRPTRWVGSEFRNWGRGEYLPRAFLSPASFIIDAAFYDLQAAPYGYEWVQNGPDALLVNLATGMVVQVVPGAF